MLERPPRGVAGDGAARPKAPMKTRVTNFLQRNLRSLVKRGAIPLADASGSYAVQHLPEWMAPSGFDFARWRVLWSAQNPRNDRADLARLVMFIENATRVTVEGIAGSIAELGVYKGTTAKLLHELLPGRTLWLFDTFTGFDARDLEGGHTETRVRRTSPTRRSRPCSNTSGRPNAFAPARATFPRRAWLFPTMSASPSCTSMRISASPRATRSSTSTRACRPEHF